MGFPNFKFSWVVSKPTRATRVVRDASDSKLFSDSHMNHTTRCACAHFFPKQLLFVSYEDVNKMLIANYLFYKYID